MGESHSVERGYHFERSNNGVIPPSLEDIQRTPSRFEKALDRLTRPWSKGISIAMGFGATIIPATLWAQESPEQENVEQAQEQTSAVEISSVTQEETAPATQETPRSVELPQSGTYTRLDQILRDNVDLHGSENTIFKGPLSSEIGKPPSVDLTQTPSFKKMNEYPDGKEYVYHHDVTGTFMVGVDRNGNVDFIQISLGFFSRSQKSFTKDVVIKTVGSVPEVPPFQAYDKGTVLAWPTKGILAETNPSVPASEGLIGTVTIKKSESIESFNQNTFIQISKYPPHQ